MYYVERKNFFGDDTRVAKLTIFVTRQFAEVFLTFW